MGIQVKPRKDIVVLAVLIHIFCILLILWNILNIGLSIGVGNFQLLVLYIFQWIFNGYAIFFPIVGIIAALRILVSLMLVFIFLLLCYLAWLCLFVIVLFTLDHWEHLANYIVNPIWIGVNMWLTGILLLLSILFVIRVLQYRSNIE